MGVGMVMAEESLAVVFYSMSLCSQNEVLPLMQKESKAL
jgi:hypothetical protein